MRVKLYPHESKPNLIGSVHTNPSIKHKALH